MPLILIVMNAQQPAVFPTDGLPVFLNHVGRDVVLSFDRQEDDINRLRRGQFCGQGLVDGNVESEQTDGGLADPDHSLGRGIHIGADVVIVKGNGRVAGRVPGRLQPEK